MAAPNSYKRDLMEAVHDHENDTIRCALGGSGTAYTFDPDNHDFVSDVFDGGTTGEELSDASYSRQTVSNATVTVDDTDDEGVFDCDDVTFPSVDTTQDIQFVLFYQQIGGDDTTPGDDRIIAVYDNDSAGSLADLPLPTNGSDIVVQINSEGLINIQ
jgi:hypothetical protein